MRARPSQDTARRNDPNGREQENRRTWKFLGTECDDEFARWLKSWHRTDQAVRSYQGRDCDLVGIRRGGD